LPYSFVFLCEISRKDTTNISNYLLFVQIILFFCLFAKNYTLFILRKRLFYVFLHRILVQMLFPKKK